MKVRCFVDVNGHVWTIDHKGNSNFPSDFEIVGNTVLVYGVKDDLGEGRAIDEEYQLWPSLTALAMTLEQNPCDYESEDGSMTLECAVAEAHKRVHSFEKHWIESNKVAPDHFPMSFPQEDTGLWFEQMNDHVEQDRE